MEWTQVLTIVGANVALIAACIGVTITLFLWARKEASADRRQMLDIINAIQKEMADFHGRMCTIEKENKGNTKC